MIHTISNEFLTVNIAEKGAELRSVKSADGCEYLWQGDEKYWEDRAPFMFPICSSVFEDIYTYRGKEYKMGLHGFAQYEIFSADKKSETEIEFSLSSTEKSHEIYPFDFILSITYILEGKKLSVRADIKNTGNDVLCAAFGAHPGFNAPLGGEGDFEDYYIEFSEEAEPTQILVAPVTGETVPLELESKKILRLRHDLFIPDGIFMYGMAKELTLRSTAGDRSVKMKYDDMKYLGIWQEYGLDTPFICIEPWCAPPTNDRKTREDLETKKDLFHIAANDTKTVSYSMEFN